MRCVTIESDTAPLHAIMREAEACVDAMTATDAALGKATEAAIHLLAFNVGKTTPPTVSRQHLKQAARLAISRGADVLPPTPDARSVAMLNLAKMAMHRLAAEGWSNFNTRSLT